MLRLAVELFDERPAAADEIRARFHAFTVDEYQDVNTLQHELLARGSATATTSASSATTTRRSTRSPARLRSTCSAFPRRYPDATIVRLEDELPVIAAGARRGEPLATKLGGFHKELRATRPDGPNPTARGLPGPGEEVAFVVAEARRLVASGIAPEQIAVIYRINARSEPYEEAFAAAGVPYQVREGPSCGGRGRGGSWPASVGPRPPRAWPTS